jgi:hypothetical protein
MGVYWSQAAVFLPGWHPRNFINDGFSAHVKTCDLKGNGRNQSSLNVAGQRDFRLCMRMMLEHESQTGRFLMKSKTLWWAVRIVAVLLVGVATSALAQAPTPVHFRGIINDYTPAHDTKGDLTGPWEMHGTWSLELNQRFHTADFSAVMTMELSDAAMTDGLVGIDDPVTRSAHTHHITMKNAMLSYDTSTCPPEPTGNPPTTPRFVVNGNADITGNGTAAPFSKGGTVLSSLQVCVTGGTEDEFSNITLVLGAPATGNFGTQAIHGAVREPKNSDQDDHHDNR